MNACFACAERDESRPYGPRPVLFNRSMVRRFLSLLLATFKENVYIPPPTLYISRCLQTATPSHAANAAMTRGCC